MTELQRQILELETQICSALGITMPPDAMPFHFLTETLIFVHLMGMSIGLGAALLADLTAAWTFFGRPPKRTAVTVLAVLHEVVGFGLIVLVATGLLIITVKFGLNAIPEKAIAKGTIALVLALNALLIGYYAVPKLKKLPSPVASSLSLFEKTVLAMMGGISLAGWVSAFLISAFKPLQSYPADILVTGAGLLALVTASVFLAMLATSGPRQREAPAEKDVPAPRREPVAACLAREKSAGIASEMSARFGVSLSNAGSLATGGMEPTAARIDSYASHGAANPLNGMPQAIALGLAPQNENEPPVQHEENTPSGRRQPKEPQGRATVASAIRACRSAFVGVGQISFVTNLLMLTGPLFMLQIYDRVLTSRSIPTLLALVAVVALLFVFLGILELIRSRVLSRIGVRIDRILRSTVYDCMVAVRPAKERARRQILQDLERIRQFMSGQGPVAAFDLPWTPIYFLVIFLLHWILGVVAVIGSVILLTFSYLNERLSREPTRAAVRQSEFSQSLASAAAQNAETVNTMGLGEGYRGRWLSAHRLSLALHLRASDVTNIFTVSGRVARLFLQSLILAAGAYLAILQEITPGAMIAASIIMSRALAPLEQAIAQWRGFIAARQGLNRIRDHTDTVLEEYEPTPLPEPQGYLLVDKLYAAAPGIGDPVLKGVGFQLEPGSVLAVVGPSASGKSTLARVLTAVWPPIRGEVRLDGAGLNHWPKEQRGRAIGYLPQDIGFLDGTVAQNIMRFRNSDPPSMLIEAAGKAEVHEMILSLPDAYETRLGEYGTALSGGQRQRIALARAIYGNPALVVLDEPNASLDRNGEAALARVIRRLRSEGTTVVIMAHRRAIIDEATHLLVLKDGRVKAFGSKSEVFDIERYRRPRSPEEVARAKSADAAIRHH